MREEGRWKRGAEEIKGGVEGDVVMGMKEDREGVEENRTETIGGRD